MWSRGRRTEESDPTEVQIQLSREEEVIDYKTKYLTCTDNFKPSIESNNGVSKESVDVCPECIMWSRGGRA